MIGVACFDGRVVADFVSFHFLCQQLAKQWKKKIQTKNVKWMQWNERVKKNATKFHRTNDIVRDVRTVKKRWAILCEIMRICFDVECYVCVVELNRTATRESEWIHRTNLPRIVDMPCRRWSWFIGFDVVIGSLGRSRTTSITTIWVRWTGAHDQRIGA